MNSGWSKDFLLPEYKSGITGRLLYSSSFYLQSTMITRSAANNLSNLPSVNTTLVNPNVTEPAGSPSQISASPRTETKGLTVLIEANLEEQIPSPEAAVSNAEQFAEEGIALLEQGEYREAEEPLLNALELDATNVSYLNAMGVAKFGQKNLPDAIEYFSRALAIQPDDTKALFNRGKAYFLQKNWPMAKVDLSRKLRMESGDSVNALRMHLQICYQLRHYDLAHADIVRLSKLIPEESPERAFIQKFKQKLDARIARTEVGYPIPSDGSARPEKRKALQPELEPIEEVDGDVESDDEDLSVKSKRIKLSSGAQISEVGASR